MAWRKTPEETVARFLAALPDDPRLERRKMFGYPCAFVNGNMCMGLHQEDMILRLSEADRAEIGRKHGAKTFEPMPGRPMREYVALPAAIVEDAKLLRAWAARSFAFVAALPAKEKKEKSATRGARAKR